MEICKISKEDLNKSINLFNSVKGRLRISITNRCNLNCFFCHKEGNKCSNLDMDFNLIQKLLKSYAELGGREVNITGGEPTLHKDFIRVIKEAKKYDYKTTLSTNALLLDKYLDELSSDDLYEVKISMHSLNQETCDKIFGNNYNINKVKEVILRLVDKKIRICLNFTNVKINHKDFRDILFFAREQGINLKLSDLIFTDFIDYTENFYLIDENINIIKEHCEFVGKISKNVGNTLLRFKNKEGFVLVKDYRNQKYEAGMCLNCGKKNICGEGFFSLRVLPEGIFKPCLLKDDYNTIWDDYKELVNTNFLLLLKFAIYNAMNGNTKRIQLVE